MEEIILKTANQISDNLYLAYLFFFISASLQVLFPPYPGDMVIATSGYFTSLNSILDLGQAHIVLIILTVFLGTIASSALVYHLGFWQGDKIFHNTYVVKYFPADKYEKAKRWVDRYGTLAIIFSKFVPGIYTLVVLMTGAFRYNKTKSYGAIIFVTFLHNGLLVYLGRKVGNNTKLIKELFLKYNIYFIAFACVIIIIMILNKLIYKKYNK